MYQDPMLIALDFDDTFTRDPDLWLAFIQMAKARGHRVVCVTCRSKDDGLEGYELGVPVYFTNGTAKRWYCKTTWNFDVDVWIDDCPEYIVSGR